MRSLVRSCSPVFAASVALSGCDRATELPATGSIEVTASTASEKADLDGYVVSVDGADPRPVAANGSLRIEGLTPGEHSVSLSGVANNCGASGSSVRIAQVSRGGVSRVAFDVHCAYARVAFAWTVDGSVDIYAVGTDGSALQRLTADAANDSTPAWSPDGARLAWASRRTGRNELYVMDADGAGVVQLTPAASCDRSRHACDHPGKSTPSWSADGQWIVFAYGFDGIGALRPDGTDVVTLVYAAGTTVPSNPALSPDQQTLVSDNAPHPAFCGGFPPAPGGGFEGCDPFARYLESRRINCCPLSAAAVSLTRARLTPPATTAYVRAVHSPDGSRLLFTSARGEILSMPAAGGPIVTHLAADGQPASWNRVWADWTRDGAKIVFTTGPALEWMNADGSGRAVILPTPGGSSGVRVRP